MISPLRAIFRRFSRPAAAPGRRRLPPRGALARRDRWESLGLGMLGSEALEQRVLMAADLAVTLENAHVWYAPAAQTVTTIVVENVFVLPGVGRLVFQAISNRDLVVVRDVVMLLAAVVVVVNFVVDVLYAWVDPRLRASDA